MSGGAWSVRVYYKPFIVWIWAGCAIMALGGSSDFGPRFREERW